MYTRTVMVLIGLGSVVMTAIPPLAAAGPICFTLVIIGWPVLRRLEDLVELGTQERDLALARTKKMKAGAA